MNISNTFTSLRSLNGKTRANSRLTFSAKPNPLPLAKSLSCSIDTGVDYNANEDVAGLYFGLHARVFYWFRNAPVQSELYRVQEYVLYIMAMTGLESLTWICGIYFLEEGSHYKGLIFLLAILLSFRIPDTFLSNDFHAACSKSGVLFNTFAWISCPEHHIGRKSLL